MTLLLTGDPNQALLALVIKEAQQVAISNHTYIGRTAVQKIMYFIKVRGVKMSYSFDIHHYGPYCEDIVTDIEWLVADGVIKDLSNNQEKYSKYAAGDAIDEIVEPYHENLLKYEEIIHDTVAALAPLDPALLELIATLDYLLRAEKATGQKHGLKTAVVDRFIQVKKDKFQRKIVESMYDIVVRMVDSVS